MEAEDTEVSYVLWLCGSVAHKTLGMTRFLQCPAASPPGTHGQSRFLLYHQLSPMARGLGDVLRYRSRAALLNYSPCRNRSCFSI